MTDLPSRLTAAIDNKAISIGEAWNLLQEAKEEIERTIEANKTKGGWRSVADKFKTLYESQKEEIERLRSVQTSIPLLCHEADRRGFERAREAMLCRLDQLVVILPDVKDESVLAYLARIMELLRTGYKKEVRAIPYTGDEGENK